MHPLLEPLSAVATVTPEYEGTDVPGATQEMYESLLETYPAIARFGDYTNLLRATGGVHADNREVDLALYGFGGYVVASFDEGYFLDRDRYFLFGELLYPRTPSPEPVFLAFDTQSDRDAAYCLDKPGGEYRLCADSLRDLLADLAERRYPCYPES
jgi:hypothetical protein